MKDYEPRPQIGSSGGIPGWLIGLVIVGAAIIAILIGTGVIPVPPLH